MAYAQTIQPPAYPLIVNAVNAIILLKREQVTNAGLDNIGSRMLTHCAEQFNPIFNYILNLSLSQQKVPKHCKHSPTVPVARFPKFSNDFQPITPTSITMQFAYRTKRGVQEATLILFTQATSRLLITMQDGRFTGHQQHTASPASPEDH